MILRLVPSFTFILVLLGSSLVRPQPSFLNHDPVLLIHGLDISPIRTLEDYADFDGKRKIAGRRIVDIDDFFLFSDKYGSKEGDGIYDSGFDLDRDGKVDFNDFFKFSEFFGQHPKPLEETWDVLSDALTKDLKWKDGGTVGKWMPSSNLEAADFYKLRFTSGDTLTFDQQGGEVKFAVDKISKINKGKKVILVGFSMGGLAARAYLQNNPTDSKASALVTICTPHVGSYLAYLPNEKLTISEWASTFKDKPLVAILEPLFLKYASVVSKNKSVIKHLAPCADSLKILNNNLYKMPTNIPYVNVVSQVPNQEVLDFKLELINKYLLNYQICKQAASPGLLAKGDGVVPTISQLFSYAIINTNAQNTSWYEKVKGNITENSEMQVSHLEGNKQTAVIKKVLQEVLEILKRPPTYSISGKVVESNKGLAEVKMTLSGKKETTITTDTNGNYHFTNLPEGTYTLVPFKEGYTFTPERLSIAISGKELVGQNFDGKSIPKQSISGARILFESNRDGNGIDGNREIYVMNADGSNQINLTKNPALDRNPSWSPDGKKIAFRSYREGNSEIYVMNADGSNPKRLTNNPAYDSSPSWSPDGSKIAYNSYSYNRGNDNYEIYVMNADGSNMRRLSNSDWDNYPVWSPDGKKIAFDLYKDGKLKIYVMNVDGTMDNSYIGSDPAWSPDGKKIAFSSSERDGNDEIYVMNADGSNQTRLTNNSYSDFKPSWSPDGKKIVFMSYRDGNKDIYVINADGSNQLRLTNHPAQDEDPSWSLNGKKIAFVSHRDGADEIYVMNADGSNVKRLTNNSSFDEKPSWEPIFDKNLPPNKPFNPSPNDKETDVYLETTLTWEGSDPEGDPLTYTVFIVKGNQIPDNRFTSGPQTRSFVSDLQIGATYSWRVVASDGNSSTEGDVWTFTTRNKPPYKAPPPPTPTPPPTIPTPTPTQPPVQPPGPPPSGTVPAPTQPPGGPTPLPTPTPQPTQPPPSTTPSPTPAPSLGKIAFESNRDGNYEIYVMNSDGSNQVRLTNNPFFDSSPSWSPDNKKIAFASNRDGNYEIYVMNADGSNPTRLTNNPFGDFGPSWSPDGSKIAFYSNKDGGHYQIYIMNADGTNQVRLTSNPGSDSNPSYGSKIAFSSIISYGDSNEEIFAINADGTNQVRLTNSPHIDEYPQWSPDGTRIAFDSYRDSYNTGWVTSEIYVMNADGSNQTRLTNNSSSDAQPFWSPDGRMLVFLSTRDGNQEIYIMNADGTNQVRLTSNPAGDSSPSWSPR